MNTTHQAPKTTIKKICIKVFRASEFYVTIYLNSNMAQLGRQYNKIIGS